MNFSCVEKDKALRQIWHLLGSGRAAGLLPCSRSEEVLVAAERFHTLYLFDRNPAILANCTRQLSSVLKKRCIRSSGFVSDLAEELAWQGIQLAAFHADSMGNVEGWKRYSLRSELERLARSGLLAGDGRLAITLLKGRESAPVTLALINRPWDTPGDSTIQEFSLSDKGRVHLLYVALKRGWGSEIKASLIGGGTYMGSHRQEMLWVVFQLSKGETK